MRRGQGGGRIANKGLRAAGVCGCDQEVSEGFRANRCGISKGVVGADWRDGFWGGGVGVHTLWGVRGGGDGGGV